MLRVGGGQLARQTKVRDQRNEVLLRAVVQVAFDPPPLGIRRRDDAGARGLELLGLLLDLVQGSLKLRVESKIAQGETDLPCQLGDRSLVALAERLTARQALRDDQPQKLTPVRDRSDPERPIAAPLEERR